MRYAIVPSDIDGLFNIYDTQMGEREIDNYLPSVARFTAERLNNGKWKRDNAAFEWVRDE